VQHQLGWIETNSIPPYSFHFARHTVSPTPNGTDQADSDHKGAGPRPTRGGAIPPTIQMLSVKSDGSQRALSEESSCPGCKEALLQPAQKPCCSLQRSLVAACTEALLQPAQKPCCSLQRSLVAACKEALLQPAKKPSFHPERRLEWRQNLLLQGMASGDGLASVLQRQDLQRVQAACSLWQL
jgi:hypothetical protein